MSDMKLIVVNEYQKITQNDFNGDKKGFDELFQYALSDSGKEVLEVGHGYVKTKNYVGLIQTPSGYSIEILPKVYQGNQEGDEEYCRKVLYLLLKNIPNLPGYKNLNLSNIHTHQERLLEVFIRLFLDEVLKLIQKGIISRYIVQVNNLNYLKGKLRLNEHIRQNIVHKERFYVEYDEFLPYIPENRILKSTLVYIKPLIRFQENQRILNELLFVFDEIPVSHQVDSDFKQLKNDRSAAHYVLALNWSKIFLRHQSFNLYSGKAISFAILFPMEKVFEKYVEQIIRRSGFFRSIKSQDSSHDFLKGNEITFKLKPDVIGETENIIFIMDAKWKILDENITENKYGISQSDLYQLFSYGKIYQSQSNKKTVQLILFYPKTNQLTQKMVFEYNEVENPLKLCIFPVPLINNDWEIFDLSTCFD